MSLQLLGLMQTRAPGDELSRITLNPVPQANTQLQAARLTAFFIKTVHRCLVTEE